MPPFKFHNRGNTAIVGRHAAVFDFGWMQFKGRFAWLMRELGLLCAFWAASIVVTEMLLNRLLILYLPPPGERRHYVSPLAARAA